MSYILSIIHSYIRSIIHILMYPTFYITVTLTRTPSSHQLFYTLLIHNTLFTWCMMYMRIYTIYTYYTCLYILDTGNCANDPSTGGVGAVSQQLSEFSMIRYRDSHTNLTHLLCREVVTACVTETGLTRLALAFLFPSGPLSMISWILP